MQPFHTINVSEMCGEVVLSQGVILLDQSAAPRPLETFPRLKPLVPGLQPLASHNGLRE